MREEIVRLIPLGLTKLPQAFWLSKESFKDEWPLVWLTYVWHCLRIHRLPTLYPMIRRCIYRLESKGRFLGGIEILSTPVHDADTKWVILDLQEEVQGDMLAGQLMRLMPRCRLAVLQTSGNYRHLDDTEFIEYEGSLPTADGEEFCIFSLRQDKLHRVDRDNLSMVSGECDQPLLDTEFYLIQRGLRSVGITGLYVVDIWPHIGWGGWGTIRRRFAQQYTILQSIEATEDLARLRGLQWFCIMTSSSSQYRTARRMYEHYGMKRLLKVDGFFHGARGACEYDSYLVYGKHL